MNLPKKYLSLPVFIISSVIFAAAVILVNQGINEPFWLTFQKYPEYYLRIFSDVCLTTLLSGILGAIYIKVGSPLNNRTLLAASFVPLSVTTLLLVAIIHNSLALSLGMVGALSIVRFRAAIKDPEELIFLFINISIGIGIGAQKQGLTLLIFITLMIILGFLRYFKLIDSGVKFQGIFVRLPAQKTFDVEKLQNDLKTIAPVKIKKYEESPGGVQIFLETSGSLQSQNAVLNYFKSRFENPTLSLSELDNGGL